ncbi:acyltransferase family protein [Pengzhenrongella phosphoraccumulans]|uniref:acyltransferase family protein n=1 Tax=Pengzhenrongella phosphoraccumulans TaxID=3114394 RepID=UPI003890F06E
MRGSNRPYLYPVDHLRAAAALLVLIYHSTQLISLAMAPDAGLGSSARWLFSLNPLKTVILEGHTGVALFMVLSGFIFTVGMLGENARYGPYIRNRALRIYPLYLVLLLVGVSATGSSFDLGVFVRAVLPLANFGPIAIGGAWGAMFWAVAIEVQFYLVFPFLLSFLNKRGPRALLEIIAAMMLLRALAVLANPAGVDLNALTYYSLVGRLDQFLLGMLAAWLYSRHRGSLTVPTLLASGAAVTALLWGFNQLHGYADPQWWRIVWVDLEGAAWAVFIASYVSVFERSAGRFSRLLARLGETSYSIYLLHFVVIGWIASDDSLWIRLGGRSRPRWPPDCWSWRRSRSARPSSRTTRSRSPSSPCAEPTGATPHRHGFPA